MLRERIKVRINEEFPKGVFVGDCCYILKGEIYDGIWGQKYEFADGIIRDDKGRLVMVVGNTFMGDGCYPGYASYERNGAYPGQAPERKDVDFAVDAGNIAIVNMEFAKDGWKDDSIVTEDCFVYEKPVHNFKYTAEIEGSFEIEINSDSGTCECYVWVDTAPEIEDEDEYNDFEDEFEEEEY